MGVKSYTCVFLLMLMPAFLCLGQSDEYIRANAQSGDGAINILKRYALEGIPCNREAFYRINDLQAGAPLYAGKTYKLPIRLFSYNGRSIRSTIGNNDWDKAVRIKKYNEAMQQKGLRSQHFTEDERLWVPWHELNCEKQGRAVAVSSRSRYIPLFGEQHGHVPLLNQTLQDKVFYVVSGHGGPDPGAMCTHTHSTLCEDEYAYDVSLRLARQLMQRGAKVHMIIRDENDGIRSQRYLECDTDERCMNGEDIPLNQLKRLKQRVDAINKLHKIYNQQGLTDQQVICIHVDSRAMHKRQDVFFYHYKGSTSGKRLAQNLHKKFQHEYARHRASGQYHGTVSSRSLYLLKYTHPTAVYVELANIQNFADRKRIVLNSNREALARWIYEGLVLNE